MRVPRVRFTVRRIMVVAAGVAVLLGLPLEMHRQGFPLVDFDDYHLLYDEPFKNPIKILGLKGNNITLEDGRVIAVEGIEANDLEDVLAESGFVVDFQAEADGHDEVFARVFVIRCGNCMRDKRRWTSPIRVPIFRKEIYRFSRVRIGDARVIGDSSHSSAGVSLSSHTL